MYSFHLVKRFPTCRISILDDIRPSFHAVVVFGLGKDFLFKSNPGRCVISNTKYVQGVCLPANLSLVFSKLGKKLSIFEWQISNSNVQKPLSKKCSKTPKQFCH